MRQRKQLTRVVGNTTALILSGNLNATAEVFATNAINLHRYVGGLEQRSISDWATWNKFKQRYTLRDLSGADYLIDGSRRLRDWHKRLKESAKQMEKAQSLDQALYVA